MKPSDLVGRRQFFGAAAAGTGVGLAGINAGATEQKAQNVSNRSDRLPREVWVATVSQEGLKARDHHEMTGLILERLEPIASCKPDIVCLPELFQYSNTTAGRPRVADAAESPLGDAGKPIAKFARDNNCYVLYSTYTTSGGAYFNSAVLLDRQGEPQGTYNKIHPTLGELELGISPGSAAPTVFETDFGRIGAQICFDIEWDDGWRGLAEAGAEIVFWQSAFAGGSAVNAKAWRNQYVVVSSCRKDTSKICDVTGEELAATGRWNRAVCCAVNLEKVFLHTWPLNRHFAEIQKKYGRAIRITNFHEEEWSVIESLSSDVRVADVIKEFELESYGDFIARCEREQNAKRSQIS